MAASPPALWASTRRRQPRSTSAASSRWAIFTSTIDYWHFDFSNPLGSESAGAILTAIFPNGAAGANNCANPAFTALIARVTFANGLCAATVGGVNNVARVHVNFINNGPQQTHGIDLSLQYILEDVFDGGDALTARVDGTYNINYRVSAQTIEGVSGVQCASTMPPAG